MMWAAGSGQIESLGILIGAGCDIDARDVYGQDLERVGQFHARVGEAVGDERASRAAAAEVVEIRAALAGASLAGGRKARPRAL